MKKSVKTSKSSVKKSAGKSFRSPARKPGKSGNKPHTPTSPSQQRPIAFRTAFDHIWLSLFSSPVHLDSALSKSPKNLKSSLAVITSLLLRRPTSVAKFLRFKLSYKEPWDLYQDQIAEWPTIRIMADRAFHSWRKDAHVFERGHTFETDYPTWMVQEWKRDFGATVTKELVHTLGDEAPLFLRATRRKGRDTVLSALNDSGEILGRAKASPHVPYGFYFPEYTAVQHHELFKSGAYEIQDAGSQLMALFALWPENFLPLLRKVPGSCRNWPNKPVPEPNPKLTIVDACAGAGGKTLALADAMLGKGQIFAYDVFPKKLEALRKRAKRAGFNNIKTVPVDEQNPATVVNKHADSADIVLIDAPCSGWGVLRRNPDIKWRQNPKDLPRLEALQEKILDDYAPLVKKGGTLVYGVCTFRKAETLQQVEAFLKRHPEFHSIGGGFYGPNPSDAFFFHAFRKNP